MKDLKKTELSMAILIKKKPQSMFQGLLEM